MNTYKVELTQGSTVRSRTIEADSKDAAEQFIECAVAMGFTGIGSIGITEVKPEIEVDDSMIFNYDAEEMNYEVLSDE